MLDNASDVSLKVNGKIFNGWLSASITKSINCLCGEFSFTASDKWDYLEEAKEIKPGDSCQVLLKDDPVISGYINEVSVNISSNSHSITVSGRDKTQDLVDCSAEVDSYEFLQQDLTEIVKKLCEKYDIQVLTTTDVGSNFEKFVVQPGETAFVCIERAAKQRGVWCRSDSQGNLVLCSNEYQDADDDLIEGINIASASSKNNDKNRYAKYIVNGQYPSLDSGAQEPEHKESADACDINVKRNRTLILSGESYCDKESAKIRAKRECTRRAGEATSLCVTVCGWRQSSEKLWQPNLLVNVKAPSIYCNDVSFIISSVNWNISSDAGITTQMDLIRPDAFQKSGEGEVKEDFHNFES